MVGAAGYRRAGKVVMMKRTEFSYRLALAILFTCGWMTPGVRAQDPQPGEPQTIASTTATSTAPKRKSGTPKSKKDKQDKTQTTVAAKTDAPTTEAKPQVVGDYEIISSVETGVRGISINGNYNRYRSDLDYKPGVRLFDSSFLMRSRDGGKGKPFDTVLVNSSGWSADPTGYTRINVEKTALYRFNANIRRFTYFNDLSNYALGQHTYDTRNKFADFDLTVLPQNKVRFNFGYSAGRVSGPAMTTYDYQRDEFPIKADAQTRSNDFRAGVDAKVGPLDLSFLQGFRWFRDDTNYFITVPILGNNPSPNSSLATFQRRYPTNGRILFSRFSLHTLIKDRLDITARLIYSSATTRFNLIEAITGRDPTGNTITLDSLNVSGESRRPNGVGDIGVTWLATRKLRISNTFGFNNFRINGDDALAETLARKNAAGVTLPPVLTSTLSFRTTNYRRFVNTIEGDYQFSKDYSFHIGYRYTDRHIELAGLDRNVLLSTSVSNGETFDNSANVLIAGFKIRPMSFWTLYFDVEHGTTDNVFTRLANYDFTNFRVRTHIDASRTVALNFSFITRDNTNPGIIEDAIPPVGFGVDVNSRIFSSTVDWTPNDRFSLSSGYTYQSLTSDAAIILFIASVRRQGVSQYFLRDHFFYFNTTAQLHPRLSFFAAYRISKDTGQGDNVSTSPTIIIGSYPMSYQSPEFRLVYRLNNRVDWNIGYQYYDYNDKFSSSQNYSAHLPYTSLRFYFGRSER